MAQGQDFPHRLDLHTVESDLNSILGILERNMDFQICIPVDFIHMKH